MVCVPSGVLITVGNVTANPNLFFFFSTSSTKRVSSPEKFLPLGQAFAITEAVHSESESLENSVIPIEAIFYAKYGYLYT